jgi:cyclophilin family peptidyl-prolyl cis-trans isomerase
MQFQKIDPRVTITTPLGEIKIRFYPDEATRHVENFLKLAKMEFYDETTFHRVGPGFIIQSGDPLSKNPDRSLHGSGSPGYWLNPETSNRLHKRGAVGMAKMPRESNSTRDPNDNGSQFYICVRTAADWIVCIRLRRGLSGNGCGGQDRHRRARRIRQSSEANYDDDDSERVTQPRLAFVRLGQSKRFHRLPCSGTSFGSGIEKLSWIGVDADFRHTAALPDHFIEGSHGIVPMGI